jgi:hypothetical protein
MAATFQVFFVEQTSKSAVSQISKSAERIGRRFGNRRSLMLFVNPPGLGAPVSVVTFRCFAGSEAGDTADSRSIDFTLHLRQIRKKSLHPRSFFYIVRVFILPALTLQRVLNVNVLPKNCVFHPKQSRPRNNGGLNFAEHPCTKTEPLP